jgi:cell filamentation protein
VPKGRFDLDHLRAIHRHLFQDVYDWAGELRTVEISKGGDLFQLRRFIVRGMADVHGRLERAHFLKNLNRKEFAEAAAEIVGDVNYVHPFREGNGRTQMQYLAALAEQAGHPLDLCLVDPARWLHASRAAHQADYRPMSAEIENVLVPF